MIMLIFWFCIFVVGALELYWFVRMLEYMYCTLVAKQIPFVPSAYVLRHAVVDEILQNWPLTKTVCDIGSGYGGLARYVSRRCGVNVVALENMPFTFFIAQIAGLFGGARVTNIYCDAFEYLKQYDGVFDVGVAYLGPGVNNRLIDVMDKFRVLIVLDVPIPNVKPVRVVDVGHGGTRYGARMYPHRLFIYDGSI